MNFKLEKHLETNILKFKLTKREKVKLSEKKYIVINFNLLIYKL